MIDYLIVVETDEGIRDIPGIADVCWNNSVNIICGLPKGKIISARAELDLTVSEIEKIFMNGYQTWTHCPEYGKHDRIRGLHGMPEFIVDKFSFDR